MNRTFLISYSHRGGFGRFVNYRQDGTAPSEEDIISMEQKIAKQNGFDAIVVLSVSELRDTQ
ncbi:hypothetical protein C3U35_004387 [Salmonella enterica subsp. enterica serovar Oranienburg]|nr:hypothetical protein [Salmonella enterica subsp. enterica serovar Oranienburg]